MKTHFYDVVYCTYIIRLLVWMMLIFFLFKKMLSLIMNYHASHFVSNLEFVITNNTLRLTFYLQHLDLMRLAYTCINYRVHLKCGSLLN